MIARLSGTLAGKSPTEVVVDVGGVSFAVSIPLSTFERLGDTGAPVALFTHLHVREDALQLYGFFTEAEREIFRMLIGVSGIGPKMAQSILSGVPAAELKNHILTGNAGALTTIPGVGRKTADRLVVELRDRIGRSDGGATGVAAFAGEGTGILGEALLALTSLGYNRAAAEKAIRGALQESPDAGGNVEALLKAALRHASR
ncbi:MAG TPA: Holliday junction branch migration protein RuvA [Bacteroidota bacterium]|nr:Holliday junction branch migration protein RuvA [Bacteroidota bacterium]